MSQSKGLPASLNWYFLMVFSGLGWGLFNILNHQSDVPTLFGRYSERYGIAVIASMVIIVGWFVAFRFRSLMWRWTERLPSPVILLFLLLTGAGTSVLWDVAGIEDQLLHFLSVNWFLVALFMTLVQPSKPGGKFWALAAVLIFIIFLFMLFITALSGRDFSPDEALWAVINSHWTTENRIYRAAILEPPYRILPGLGWVNLLHSLSLEHFSFHIHSGRILNYLFYALTLAGAGALTRLLFGNMAAFFTIILLTLGQALFTAIDYRPDHFIAFASMLIFYAALVPRVYPGRYNSLWHFVAGLLATLSLQLHASGLGFAVGLSLFYVLEFFWQVRKNSLQEALLRLVSFGGGALVGTLTYYAFNIASVGGLDVFLGSLISERGNSTRSFKYLQFYALEALFVVPGLAFLALRRDRGSRLYLALLVCTTIGITLIDTQGYMVGYRTMFVIPTGALLVAMFNGVRSNPTEDRRLNWLALWICLALSGYALRAKVDLGSVRFVLNNGALPPHSIHVLTDAIREELRSDDRVIVGGIELIWAVQYRDQFVAFHAEGYHRSVQGGEELAVFWEEVSPDVIVFIPRRESLPPGLQEYMREAGFQLCTTQEIIGHEIRYYRSQCDIP